MRLTRPLAARLLGASLVLCAGLTAGAPVLRGPGATRPTADSLHTGPAQKVTREAPTALVTAGHRVCAALPDAVGKAARDACNGVQDDLAAGYPTLWGLSQAVSATLSDARQVDAGLRRQYTDAMLNAFAEYADGQPFSHGLTPRMEVSPSRPRFYDDNAWVGMDLMEAFHLTKDERLLDDAEHLYDFERTGIADGCPRPWKGDGCGVYWSTDKGDRGAVSTAGAVELALELYAVDGNHDKLTFAEHQYQWVRGTLMSPANLYHDSWESYGYTDPHTKKRCENHDGCLVPDIYAYNQALMITDGRELWQASGQVAYLQESLATAQASLTVAPFVSKPKAELLTKKSPVYYAIWFGALQHFRDLDVPEGEAAALTDVNAAARAELTSYAHWVKRAVSDPSATENAKIITARDDWPLQPAGAARVLILSDTWPAPFLG